MDESPKHPLRTRLAERVRDALRTEIQEGRWKKQLPPERYLSQEFQVGRPTLHDALRALEREGLLQGRPRNPWLVTARPVATEKKVKRWAGVVVLRNARAKPDLTSIMPVIDRWRHELHHLGLDLVVVDALMHGTKQLKKTLSAVDADYRPSFYFLIAVPPEVHRWFDKQEIPTLILGSRPPEVRLPAIDVDHEAVIRHAVEHLFRRGHRRVGLFLSTGGVGDSRMARGFEECCLKHRADGFEGILRSSLSHPGAAQAAVRKFFERTPFPTAIIVADLETTIAVYTTLGELGLAIPRKVSVILLADWPLIEYFAPSPSCYVLPWKRMAMTAVRIVAEYQRMGVWPNRFYNVLPAFREGRSVAGV